MERLVPSKSPFRQLLCSHIPTVNNPKSTVFPYNSRLCAKRLFTKVQATKTNGAVITKRVYHAGPLEFQKFATELNVFKWSRTLLCATYQYVDSINEQKGVPPFQIPVLRFVECALAQTQAYDQES